MDDHAEAYKALAKAQAEMGKALKTATNPHFKKNYADLGAVQEACFDALRANGFAVFQPTGRDEYGPFVKTIFAHASGQTLECRTDLLVDKNNMQGLGSAITYARRYGLLCMSGLSPEDDDGNANADQHRAAEEAVAQDEAKYIDDARQMLINSETKEGFEETCLKIRDRYKGWSNVPKQLSATITAKRAELEGKAA